MDRPTADHDEVGDDLEALRARIGDPRRWLFVVDFDGTLAPIVEHPDAARPAPGALEAIADLGAVSEVALLSGRGLDDLEARLGEVPPGVVLVGGHGSEARRADGSRVPLTDLDAATEVLDGLASRLATIVGGDDGWQLERKSTSLAIHHRRVDPAVVATVLPRVREVLTAATGLGPGFVVLDGKAVVEFKLAGIDKGVALRWIVEQAGGPTGSSGQPAIKPLVLGDDTTDEDAFEVALELDGEGVLISEGPVATNARFRLRDPSRVVTLLRTIHDAPDEDAPPAGPRDGSQR